MTEQNLASAILANWPVVVALQQEIRMGGPELLLEYGGKQETQMIYLKKVSLQRQALEMARENRFIKLMCKVLMSGLGTSTRQLAKAVAAAMIASGVNNFKEGDLSFIGACIGYWYAEQGVEKICITS